MYEIIRNYITQNRSHETLNPIGLVVHSTDDLGATDENEQAYFNSGNRQASAHAFIDWDSITETIPDNEVAWGSGFTSNHKFLQVELCEPGSHNVAQFLEVWNRAVWYFAYKLVTKIKCTSVSKSNVLSHAEVSDLYKETNHQDPVSYFAEYGKTVDQFRAEVQDAINSMINPIATPSPSVNSDALKLQQTLNRLKIRDGKGNLLAEDGIIGSCTKEAIKRLQSICGLSVDGIAGQQTWGAINAILAKPLLKTGINGIATRYLQFRVGASYDGIFGWDTNRKVAIWQGQNGLTQDGIVGPCTWSKLIG